MLLVSTLLLTKPFYVVFCSGIQLTIDRLDRSGHLIPRFNTKHFGRENYYFKGTKRKCTAMITDTSLNIYLKRYAGTMELHVRIPYKRIRCFMCCVFPPVRGNFNFHPILLCVHLRCKKYATFWSVFMMINYDRELILA